MLFPTSSVAQTVGMRPDSSTQQEGSNAYWFLWRKRYLYVNTPTQFVLWGVGLPLPLRLHMKIRVKEEA